MYIDTLYDGVPKSNQIIYGEELMTFVMRKVIEFKDSPFYSPASEKSINLFKSFIMKNLWIHNIHHITYAHGRMISKWGNSYINRNASAKMTFFEDTIECVITRGGVDYITNAETLYEDLKRISLLHLMCREYRKHSVVA